MAKVHAKQQAAMDAQASSGSTAAGILEAGMRAAFQHGLDGMEPELSRLEAALGFAVDGGSFFLGMQGAACAVEGINIIDMASHPISGPLLREFTVLARRQHEDAK